MDEWNAEASRHLNAPFDGPAPDATPGIAEGVAPQPDDFDSVPYEYDPVAGAWVKLID